MVLVGMILGYMLFGMIPRLFSGKIRTAKKIYILLTIDAVISIPVILAPQQKSGTTISIIIALILLYFIFKKELKNNIDKDKNGYIDFKGKYHPVTKTDAKIEHE